MRWEHMLPDGYPVCLNVDNARPLLKRAQRTASVWMKQMYARAMVEDTRQSIRVPKDAAPKNMAASGETFTNGESRLFPRVFVTGLCMNESHRRFHETQGPSANGHYDSGRVHRGDLVGLLGRIAEDSWSSSRHAKCSNVSHRANGHSLSISGCYPCHLWL